MKNALPIVLAMCLAPAPAWADNYPRQNGIDIQHYVFRITLSDETDEISGETTVDVRFVRDGVGQVALDLTTVKGGKGMTVTSVTRGGATATYKHAGDRLTIEAAGMQAGERAQYTIAYHGVAGN